MKTKLSITMEEEIVKELELLLEGTRFRNMSHVIEHAVDTFLKNKGELK